MDEIFFKFTESAFKKIRRLSERFALDSVGPVMAAGLDKVLRETPIEVPGRMHAAWIAAAQDLISKLPSPKGRAPLERVIAKHQSDAAEKFDLSWQHGHAEVNMTGGTINVKLINTLSFASIMEHGGVLTVGVDGATGTKMSKTFPGQLGGQRSVVGSGMLRWVDKAGNERMSKTRNMPGTHSIIKARAPMIRKAKVLGFVT